MQYTVKDNRRLTVQANGIVKTISGYKSTCQQFLGDFIVSYSTTKNNNPFNMVIQALKGDAKLAKYVYEIAKWVKANTSYEVYWKKESNYYGIRLKDGCLEESFEEGFYSTTFYEDKDEQDKNNKKTQPVEVRVENYLKGALKELSKEQIVAILNRL